MAGSLDVDRIPLTLEQASTSDSAALCVRHKGRRQFGTAERRTAGVCRCALNHSNPAQSLEKRVFSSRSK
jgi:hypothetical protein